MSEVMGMSNIFLSVTMMRSNRTEAARRNKLNYIYRLNRIIKSSERTYSIVCGNIRFPQYFTIFYCYQELAPLLTITSSPLSHVIADNITKS